MITSHCIDDAGGIAFMMSFGANEVNIMSSAWTRENTSTFRDSPWTDALNAAIRCELAAVDIYSLLIRSANFEANSFVDEHAHASRKLAVLVIARRGVPADRPAAVMAGFNKAILQVCSLMPDEINERFSRSRLAGLEKQLCLMYAALASNAPTEDRQTLDQLGTGAADRHLFLRRSNITL